MTGKTERRAWSRTRTRIRALCAAAWSLACLPAGAALAQAGAPADLGASAAGSGPAPSYRVINLGAGSLSELPAINARGQVAFSLFDAAGSHAWFYDGRTLRNLGTLGGASAYAVDLNDAGQVAGYADTAAGPAHAFRWSAAGGMADLGVVNGGPSSRASAINRAGAVAGWSDIGSALQPLHGFVWRPASGIVDLGNAFGDGLSLSTANAINDAGAVAGDAETGGPSNDNHAFYWTPGSGMLDVGTLDGGTYSYAVALDAAGGVTGWADVPGGANHAFHWTRAHGIHDLGTAGGAESFPLAMSAGGQMVGVIDLADGNQHAMSWTRTRGMHDLGTLGGASSRALAVNGKGQVAGSASVVAAGEPAHAFLWSPGRGMIDLNRRVGRLPAGLVLESADAIGDDGAIVAETNAGLVLLEPDGGCTCGAALGPIDAAPMVAAGAPFSASASFADDAASAAHHVSWAWGDGAADAPLRASERAGAGSANAQHVYARPGVYTVTAQVSDGAGHSAAVSREVVVVDASAHYAAGAGALMSPPGAVKAAPGRSSKAKFAFFAGAQGAGQGSRPFLVFSTAGFALRSEAFRIVSAQGGAVQFEGSGRDRHGNTVSFTLSTSAGGADTGRFALKVWRIDPLTHAEVVDYDNRDATNGAAPGLVAEGRIALQM